MSQVSSLTSTQSITRLVKMTFLPDKTAAFEAIFAANKNAIAAFPGCSEVQLKRDVNFPNVFFTISKWNSEEALENYRKSELFNGVWSKTKVLFSEKAEAWSLKD